MVLFFYFNDKEVEEIIINEFQEKNEANETIKIVEDIKLKVDIKGRIEKPGVYELDQNSRVIDQTTPNMIQKLKV